MNYFGSLVIWMSLIAFSLDGYSQLNYKSGYIINLENDTIHGLVNDGGEIRNVRVCWFKPDKKTKVKKYYPGEIISYRFDNDKYYQSNIVSDGNNSRNVFTEVLVKGKISMFYYLKNSKMAYYIEKENGELIGLLNKEVKVPITEDLMDKKVNYYNIYDIYEYQNNNLFLNIDIYKDTLYSILEGHKNLQNQLMYLKYTKKAMLNLTKGYISEICNGKDCILYEKNLKLSKPSFGVYSGIQFSKIYFWETYSKALESASESKISCDFVPSVPLGVFCNFPIPKISDKLSVQIELQTASIYFKLGSISLPLRENPGIKMNSISVPFMIKYRLLNHTVSPTIAIGKAFSYVYYSDAYEPDMIIDGTRVKMIVHKNQLNSIFYELGMNYKINRKISLFSNLRYQSNYNLIVSGDPRDTNFNTTSYSNIIKNKDYYDRFRTSTLSLYIGINF
jgi:hypothetical protein